ncbi:DUF7507 domain-containing protein [Clostridium taeniosporum]|uniref:DUF11 domain-containing protein n=1 Tax=Clostridium taeniosporum TaxID=394958 RepID=A0A1D7XJ29_9CLOT|nr:GEVED domain-containing protein [Clostridium taeniosporum]AOR23341.1 hypothetical protein BGI42_06155 [Clostridium taeniosporum]
MPSILRYSTTARGSMVITGNTLGLLGKFNPPDATDTDVNANGIGAFISLNNGISAPGGYPLGTTFDWRENGSDAIIDIPVSAKILYAELSWSGSYLNADQDVSAFLDNAITFNTPLGSFQVNPDAATAGSVVFPTNGVGQYFRSANVTTLVNSGTGTYSVQSIPGVLGGTPSNPAVENNYLGWSLEIAYEDVTLPYRNMNVWTIFDPVDLAISPIVDIPVSGFSTPISGSIKARLLISAGEGDPQVTGDQVLFGPDIVGLVALQGEPPSPPNNPVDNFFVSRINDGNSESLTVGQVDTLGSFGTLNQPVPTTLAGRLAPGRYGYDITNVDASTTLVNSQTNALIRLTTSGDGYVPNLLGLQIDSNSPIISINKSAPATATRGSDITYTLTVTNTGVIQADTVTVLDPAPTGTTVNPGSVTVQNATGPVVNNSTAATLNVDIGPLLPNQVVTIQYTVSTTGTTPTPVLNSTTANYTFVPIPGGNVITDTSNSNETITAIANKFVCEPFGYRVAAESTGTNSTLLKLNLVTGEVDVLNPDIGMNINAIGYNVLDNLIYGIENTTTNLVILDSTGTTSVLGPVPNLPLLPSPFYNTGTIDNNGHLYIKSSTDPNYYVVDVNSSSPTFGQLVDPLNGFVLDTAPYGTPINPNMLVADWTVSSVDGNLYGVENTSGNVVSLNPLTGVVTVLTTSGIPIGAYGAVYSINDQYIYATNNTTGVIYRIEINGDNATGIVFSSDVPSNNNDGAACLNAELLIDFGDAPDPTPGNGPNDYSTLLANNGPRHQIINQLYLGTQVTAENDAYANITSDATGDDIIQGIQDDGLVVPLTPMLSTDTTYALNVSVTNNTGLPANLYGWIDFNEDGIFQGNEAAPVQIVPSALGLQQFILNFIVPVGVVLQPDHTFVRLRLTTDDLINQNSLPIDEDTRSIGPASDGEVEDYYLTITPVADISVVKTGAPNPVVVGNTLTYTMVVSNLGPSDAQSVSLTDAVPACILNPVYSVNGGTSNPWPVGGINLGTIASGATPITVTISGTVDPACTESSLVNTATVSSPTPDPDPSNNTSTVTTQVNQSADIKVVKTASPSPVVAGQTLTYTMVVSNLGPSDAQSVSLTDAVPACILNPVYSVNGGASNPWPVGGINLGTIAVGATPITVTISGTVDPACAESSLVNTAIVSSPTPDPDPSNNTSTVTTQVNQSADISVVKTGSSNPVVAGNILTYTMVVSNLGPSDAQSVSLTDAVPACILNPVYSVNGGTSNPWPVGGINLGTIASGATPITVTISGTVDPACTESSLVNTATVSSPTPDLDPNNNTSTVTTTVNTLADVSVVKTANPINVNRGDVVTYTIVVSNAGPSDAQSVSLADVVPSELLNPEFSINNGVSWNIWSNPYSIGTLTAGTSKTIFIRGTISNTAIGTVNNTATVSSSTPDPNPDNNTSSASIEVNYADLVAPGNFVKAVDKQYADIGDEITYTINVTNTGNTIANNVVITDPIPNGTSYVSGSLIASAPVTGTPAGGINVTNGIAPGATLTLSYKVKVIQMPVPNPIPNTASISYTYTVDPNNPNGASGSGDTNTVFTQVNHGEILPENAVKTVDTNPTTPGDIITYTVSIKNTGNVPVDALVTDVVPTGTQFVTGTVIINGVSKPAKNPNFGIKIIGIPAGEIANLSFKVKVLDNAPSTLINNAKINYSYVVDPALPPVNKDVTTNTVNVTVLKPELTLVKSADRTGAVVGDIIRYSITATNTGEIPLQNVIVKDVLAPELSYIGNLTINGVPSGQSILTGVNIEDLSIGEVKTISFDAKVNAIPADKTINNTSTATFNYIVSGKNFSGNATSNEETIRVYNPELTMTKMSNNPIVKVGDTFQYTITAENTGDIIINDVIVKDDLPPEFEVVQIIVNGDVVNGDIEAGINIGNLAIGESVDIVLTIQVLADLTDTFQNIATGTGTSITDPNKPPVIVEGEGEDPGVTVYNPKLELEKSVDKPYVIVGDTVTYTVVAKNTGDIVLGNVDLDPIVIYDLLGPSLEFVSGSVTIDGISDPLSGIVNGVILGVLNVGESKTVTFKAKVLSNDISPIENTAQATFGYQIPGDEPETGNATSNTVQVIPEIANLEILKEADTNFAVMNDVINYTVTVTNTGTLDANNVIFTDELPPEVELIDGSFKVDGIGINNVDLRQGVNIGTIKTGEEAIIEYSVKVIATNCELKIKNSAIAKFQYRLPNGTTGTVTTDPSETSTVIVNLGISNFKQLFIEENLIIPDEKPDIEEINEVNGDVEIIKHYVVETPILKSNEGQILTGCKLIIQGVLNEVVEYTALDSEQTIHSAHYSIPFSTFIILPENYCYGNEDITTEVEDIYFNSLNSRKLFTNATILIKATVSYCK